MQTYIQGREFIVQALQDGLAERYRSWDDDRVAVLVERIIDYLLCRERSVPTVEREELTQILALVPEHADAIMKDRATHQAVVATLRIYQKVSPLDAAEATIISALLAQHGAEFPLTPDEDTYLQLAANYKPALMSEPPITNEQLPLMLNELKSTVQTDANFATLETGKNSESKPTV